jgi:ribonucleotide reductase alpha subunit
MLIRLGLTYYSAEVIVMASRLMETIFHKAFQTSCRLAEQIVFFFNGKTAFIKKNGDCEMPHWPR